MCFNLLYRYIYYILERMCCLLMINSSKFIDNYFKFLVLLFWPIIWYKWTIISTYTIDLTLVMAFSILSIIYFILYLYFCYKKQKIEKIIVIYRITLVLSFISTLFSFLLYPTSILLLLIKIIFIGICFYYSCLKVFKYKLEEGLVGILSCILLLIITFLY